MSSMGDKRQSNKQSAEKTSGRCSDNKKIHLYKTEIRYLTEELERFKVKWLELEKQKKYFYFEYTALEKEKNDIANYLDYCVSQKEEEAEQVKERLVSVKQAADKDREALELLKKKFQDREEELTRENKTLVASMEECKTTTEKLTSEVESLEKQVVREAEQHEAEIKSLAKKVQLDKQSYKREMESRMIAKAAEVQRLVDQEVAKLTREALQTNAELKPQLDHLLEKAKVLVKENSVLRDRKKKLAVEVDFLKDMIVTVSNKNHLRKKAAGTKC